MYTRLRSAAVVLALGLATQADAAEPIFVPDFTPGTGDEFAVTVMIQGLVVDQLVRDGHIVLSSDVVAGVVGRPAVTDCAALPTCPQQVLPQIPTRVAVVGRIQRAGPTLVGHVELFEQSNPNPLDVRDVGIAPGNEHLFAAEVAKATRELLARVGPSPDSVLLAAARLIAGQPPAAVPPPQPVPIPSVPIPVPPPPPAPVAPPRPMVDLDAPTPTAVPKEPVAGAPPVVRQKKGDGSTPHTGPIDPILEGTGVSRRHLVGAEQQFMKAGLDPRDWVYRTMPHAGRAIFEVRAGLGLGDSDRIAHLRVETTDGQQTNAWYQEGPSPNRRMRGGVFVGYAPATMVDLGLLAGLQYGERILTTGIYRLDAAGVPQDVAVADPAVLQAVQAFFQPRVRAYLVPTGPVKPFLFTGGEIRIFDRYQIDQPPDVTYPSPPSAVVPGWVGGGGLMIDPGPMVGFFFEGSFTRHFGIRSARSEYWQTAPWPYEYTPIEATGGFTVGLVGGLQFRL